MAGARCSQSEVWNNLQVAPLENSGCTLLSGADLGTDECTHSPGLAVTSSHSHHVGASANQLDAGVPLKELQTPRSCWQMGCAGILLRVIWADSLDLSSPSHPAGLRKRKHRTDQREKKDSTNPFVGLAPKSLYQWLLSLCPRISLP